MKILQAIMAMKMKFAEKCPPGKRGRPMSKSPQAAEAEGIEVCEKETKDGRTVAYKTSNQLNKERMAKSDTKVAREKLGLKSKGRLSIANLAKVQQILEELRSLRQIIDNKLESKIEEGSRRANSPKEDSGGSKIEAALARSGRLPKEEASKPKIEIKWEKGGAIEKKPPEIQAEIANEIKTEIARLNKGGAGRPELAFPDDPVRQKELNEKVAPRPNKPQIYDDEVVTNSLRAAYKRILDEHPLRVTPQFPDIYNEMRKDLPGLTKNQFKAVVQKGREKEIIDVYHVNSPGAVEDGDLAIFTSMGALYYLGLR